MIVLGWHGFCRVDGVDTGDDPIVKKINILNVNVISLVDRLCYMAPFNCKSTLEQLPLDSRRQALANIKAILQSETAAEQFQDSWNDWLRANPPSDKVADNNAGTRMLQDIYGTGDESADDHPSPAGDQVAKEPTKRANASEAGMADGSAAAGAASDA